MALDKPLTTEIVAGELRISIGLRSLAFAIEHGPQWPPNWKVDEAKQFQDFGSMLIYSLNDEEEDGSTPIHRMLDEVVANALDQGEEGFTEVDGE